MVLNNFKIAFRNLRKHKLFAAINIIGLALGMAVYLLAGLIARYESNHDAFFVNAERIYTLGINAAPGLNVGISKLNVVNSAVGPILEAEHGEDVDAVARTLGYEFLVSEGADGFYERVTFTDPSLLEIFDFTYLGGDANALKSATGLVLNRSTAMRYFGTVDAVGKVLTFDNQYDFSVQAVIEDVPRNSHFNSSLIMEGELNVIAPIAALSPLRDFDVAGEWNNLSLGNMTYVMLPPSLDGDWLQAQMDRIYATLMPEDQSEVIASFYVDPLQRANLAIWDAIGMPVITVIQLLGLMVLIVACVNYTNLATAQSLGRTREVGMRKTMGADQRQLLIQFLVESLVIAAIAMFVAVACLELAIPIFNNLTNKVMALNYLQTLPWLVTTTVLVGLAAGLYPAWLITRTSPIEALRDLARKGRKGAAMRSTMIGLQFGISAFMLALVAIVYVQNEKVKEGSYIFPRDEVYTLSRLGVDEIAPRLDTLKNELEALPGVAAVGFSSQIPFEQSNSQRDYASKPGDEASEFRVNVLRMSPGFLPVYDIPLLAGRNLDRDIAGDVLVSDETEVLNVLVNELTLERMGITSPEAGVGQRLYRPGEEGTLRELMIVGVLPTQNILGLFNQEKPWVFLYSPPSLITGSLRITGGDMLGTISQVEDVWKRVIPEYPMQGSFLNETFDEVYDVLKYMNSALAGFAAVALALAMIGLFGLAAFMAAQRTKEIGVRKVLGASSLQIAGLLVWQFSKPVLWALAVALPAAFFATKIYLNFFADRIESPILLLAAAGATAVVLAWATIAGHAWRIARANPIRALRYE
ncbi:MAG: FtsX-like permease family protein [Pseudomonadota bacterium]